MADLPGPRGLPFVGHVFQMDKEHTHLWLKELSTEYGPVFRLKLLDSECVFLNTIEVVNEAMVTRGTDCMAVKLVPRTKALLGADISVSSMSEPQYPVLRKCVEDGMQHTVSLEETHSIHKQICLDIAEKYSKFETIDVASMIRNYVTRALSQVVLGGNNQYEDEKSQFCHEVDLVFDWVINDESSVILDLKPSLFKHKFIKSGFHKKLDAEGEKLDGLCKTQLSKLRESITTNLPTCVMEHLIMRQEHDKRWQGHSEVQDSHLEALLKDLAFGAYPGSINLISEMINLLLTNQSLQERLQKEIDSNFSQNYFIKISDKGKLPQMEAFVFETLRYCPPLPVLVPHCTERDTVIGGCKVPAGVWVWVNYYTISRNEEIYPEPDTFNIDRFLDCDGKLLPEDHPVRMSLIPFGVGARSCPGQFYSKQSYFEMICHLLQNYTLQLVGDSPVTDPRFIRASLTALQFRYIESWARLIKRTTS